MTPGVTQAVLQGWEWSHAMDASDAPAARTADVAPAAAADWWVPPDGCRDLIVSCVPGMAPTWFVSPLMDSAMQGSSIAGQRMAGVRCHPAARLSTAAEAGLVAAAVHGQVETLTELQRLVGSYVTLDERLAEALAVLEEAVSVAAACRLLGVHERSLQRLVGAGSGRPPAYWLALARLRRTALRLEPGRPLADLAAAQGYADQAHMSRAFRHWLGMTPTALRQSPERLALLRSPGFGNVGE